MFQEMRHGYVSGLSCKPNIHVSWSTSTLRVRMAHRETGLSPPVKYFTDRSNAVLLLWIICVNYVLWLSCFRICSLLPCGHLKGKAWPLGPSLWSLLWFCYFPIWYPGTGVALDCIDSWSMLSFLLLLSRITEYIIIGSGHTRYWLCLCLYIFNKAGKLVWSSFLSMINWTPRSKKRF